MWSTIFKYVFPTKKPVIKVNRKQHKLKIHFMGVQLPDEHGTSELEALKMFESIACWFHTQDSADIRKFECEVHGEAYVQLILRKSTISEVYVKEDIVGIDYEESAE